MNIRDLISKLDLIVKEESDEELAKRVTAAQQRLADIEKVKQMAATPVDQIPRLGWAIEPKTGAIYYNNGTSNQMAPASWDWTNPKSDAGKLFLMLKSAGLQAVQHKVNGLFGTNIYAKVDPVKLAAVVSGKPIDSDSSGNPTDTQTDIASLVTKLKDAMEK